MQEIKKSRSRGNRPRVSRNGLELTGWPGAVGKAVVPDGVRSIGSRAFAGTAVSEVELPGSCVTVRKEAFKGCRQLERVVAPACQEVGRSAFQDCTSLRAIEMEEGLQRIGRLSFAGCRTLESIRLAIGLEVIPVSAFAGCSSLLSPDFPLTLRQIQPGAFDGCGSIERISLPPALEELGTAAFNGCRSLREASLPESAAIGDACFLGCPAPTFVPWPYAPGCHTPAGFASQLACVDSAPELLARVVSYEAGGGWRDRVERIWREHPEVADPTVRALLDTLDPQSAATGEDAPWPRALAFVATYHWLVSDDMLCQLLEYLSRTKNLYAADFARDQRIAGRVGGASEELPTDLALRKALASWTFTEAVPMLRRLGVRGVAYADGSGTCEPEGVLHLVAESISTRDTAPRMKARPLPSTASGAVIASLLDQGDLRLALDELATAAQGDQAVLVARAWCQYADNKRLEAGLDSGCWSGKDLDEQATQAILATLRRERMSRAARENPSRDAYLTARFATPEECRASVYGALGFDENGTREISMGNRSVTARVENSDVLLYTTRGKAILSLPDSSSWDDPARRPLESARLHDSRSELAEMTAEGLDMLRAALVDGRSFDYATWRVIFMGHPILHLLASTLVWQQGANLFTIGVDGPCDEVGVPYKLTLDPIVVAHPAEMGPEKMRDWCEYFEFFELEQAIPQLETPVVDPHSLNVDRYRGIAVPSTMPVAIREFLGEHAKPAEDGQWREVSSQGGTLMVENLGGENWNNRDMEFMDLYPGTSIRATSWLVRALDKVAAAAMVRCDSPRIRTYLGTQTDAEVQSLRERAGELEKWRARKAAREYQVARDAREYAAGRDAYEEKDEPPQAR